MSNTNGSSGGGQSQAQSPLARSVYSLTSGKAYDADQVYKDASDARGHYEQVNCKVPPRMEHVMNELVAAHEGYSSRQDFIRNAIMHQAHRDLERLQSQGVDIDPLALQLVEAEANQQRIDMRRRLREAQRAEYEHTREEVEELIVDRDWDAINAMLDRVALLCDNPDLPGGQRDRYDDLYSEMSDALTRAKMRELKAQNRKKQRDRENAARND